MKIFFIVLVLISFSTFSSDTDVNFKKVYNTGIASDPSYCIGYADGKLFQTGHLIYYKWMKEWYEGQASSTDFSMKPFSTESYINGTEMNDNDLTVECVYEFDYILEKRKLHE